MAHQAHHFTLVSTALFTDFFCSKTHAIKENQFSELLAKCIKVVSADQELQKHSTIDDQMKETNEGIQYTLE